MKNSYNLRADIIRVVAISGVLIIHTANAVFARPDFFGGISWWFALALNSISRSSIPLFIMISGFFILEKKESFEVILKRSFSRIVIPLLFWFMLYMAWWSNDPLSFEWVNFSLIIRLLTVNVFDLYFLLILFGLYLITPILRRYVIGRNEKKFMFLLLFLGSLYFAIEYWVLKCAYISTFTYPIPFVGLFVAGHFFGQKNNSVKKIYPVFGLTIFFIVTLLGGYLYFLERFSDIRGFLNPGGCLTHYFDSSLSINVVGMSVCIYILIMNSNVANIGNFIKGAIYRIARSSFGIYVLHVLVLDILDSRYGLFDRIAPAWLYLTVKWVVIFGVSYLLSEILTKLRFIKRAFGER